METSPQDRSLAMWMHLGPLLGGVASMILPIPFLTLMVAAVLYFTQKDKSAFAAEHGKESLNFQITITLILIVVLIVAAILFGGAIFGAILGSSANSDEAAAAGVMGAIGSAAIIGIVMMVVGIAALVFMVIAIIKANNGEAYRYPIALRLVK